MPKILSSGAVRLGRAGAALTLAGAWCAPGVASGAEAGGELSFNRDIRPILSDRCFSCHGPDRNKRKAGLRLDTREGALAPLDDGGFHAVVPGDPDKSEAWFRITSEDPDEVMPPPESKLPALDARERGLLRRWIEEGAEYQAHWSFIPPERPAIPQVSNPEWVRDPIDAFVLARLDEVGLAPSPEADRRTLARRLALDLTGIPPTPEEVDAFVADSGPDACGRFVDRLLGSPRFGERMAVDWLDAARYADTSGFQYDWPRTMWRWRDWVIDAYNANLPYDEFVTWQLAGDLLPEATLEQRIATGFNRNHPFTIEGGVVDEEYRLGYVADRVTTMGTVFMGLTLECARCHDHKFDDVSKEDFYRLFAFFNNVPEKGFVGGKPAVAPPAIKAPTRAQAEVLAAVDAQLAALDAGVTEAATDWQTLRPVRAASSGGCTLEILGDDSVRATGANPDRDAFTLEFDLPTGLAATGLRLEALTDPSMVDGGPGRAHNGNAVMSGIEAAVDGHEIVLQAAAADHEQDGYPVRQAIDDDAGSGWAVEGNLRHENRVAAFRFAEPVEGASLKVTLRFESVHATHAFGRVRLAVTGAEDPLAALLGRRGALLARKKAIEDSIVETMVMVEMESPRETFVLERGQYDQRRELVSAGTPAALPPFPEGAPPNRLGLARWLTSPDHPLLARVTVNRLWHQLFGTGIVKTVNDFGAQGEWPTHPDLLDWLAVEFVESGFDLKAMVRRIACSATYRQASRTTPGQFERDPANRLLARGPRHRLSAETLRDQALAASGLLVEKVGGPSVKPYQPAGLWAELTNRPGFKQVYEQDSGDALYRRSLYTFWKRASPPPAMATFDAPNREVCTFNRLTTNTPLQALVLLHDPTFVEAARALADRVRREAGPSVDRRIDRAFRLVTARPPEPAELEVLRGLFDDELARFQSAPQEATELLAVGRSPSPPAADAPDAAAMTMVTRTILNLSETVTKN